MCLLEFMQKPLGNVVFPVIATTAVERSKEPWHSTYRLSKKDCGPGFAAHASTKLIPRHAICIPGPVCRTNAIP